jgi:imidazolonepropionase-like amidohydrolase
MSMRNRRWRVIYTFVALFTLWPQLAPAVCAQRSAIETYAITNARIVPVNGAIIERGTIVIRRGLIAAVGAQVQAPADARVIDGTGLTIYPGLIDANTTLGLPQPSATPGTGERRGGGSSAPSGPQLAAAAFSPFVTPPVGLQPETLAVDALQPGGAQIEAARNAGLTAALMAPREGILLGQSAFINLAGETSQQMIVRSPVGLHVSFTPFRGGQYPASLMGVFATLRQMFLDAGRLRDANQIYARSPKGLRRPTQDKSLLALQPFLARELPIIMHVNTEREIRRALDLAQEFNLRVIISGGAESWKVTERLQDVPVLLSLNFPKRTAQPAPEADPDPLRVLRERANAPKTAGRLAAARVRFAFQSGAMTNINDYLANAAKAIENGLAREEALRALTINAAEILGVADRLGTIEVGKIANLTITRGDLFDRRALITHVFIDGQPVDLKPATPPASATNLSSVWTLSLALGTGNVPGTLRLERQGSTLTGTLQSAFGTTEFSDGSIGPDGFRFTTSAIIDGRTVEMVITGTITGNQMRGTITSEIGSTTFTGTKPQGSER